MNLELNNYNFNLAGPENDQLLPVQTQALNHFPLQTEAEDDELIKADDGVIKLQFSSFESLFNLILNVNLRTSDFYKRLKRIEETNDIEALPHEIIARGLKRALRAGLEKNSVFKAVHALFKRKLPSLADFYCSILSVFVKTCLPGTLNECLRSGDLTRAGRLLPYLVCLCQAFFCEGLDSNRIKGQIKESEASNLYLEIDENQNRFMFDRKIELKEFLIMKMEKPRKGTYLHIEIPAEVTKDLKHSVYLELDRNRIIFVREAGKAILAPGCVLSVSYIDDTNPGTRIIKLKMVAKACKKINFQGDDGGFEVEEIQTKSNPGFWDVKGYDEVRK